jgi:hypothetical protein
MTALFGGRQKKILEIVEPEKALRAKVIRQSQWRIRSFRASTRS